MYVLLQGKVTVYIQYSKADVDDRPSLLPNQQTNKSDLLRHTLGTFVTYIGLLIVSKWIFCLFSHELDHPLF